MVAMRGQAYRTPWATLKTFPADTLHIGVSVPKKVSKSATARNTIRRRVYPALFDELTQKTGHYFVQIHKDIGDLTPSELKKQIHALLEGAR